MSRTIPLTSTPYPSTTTTAAAGRIAATGYGASSNKTSRNRASPESFHDLARRCEAAEVLQSYEMLSWFSFARCESITQTRLHFQNLLAGFTDQDESLQIDWRTDTSPFPAKKTTQVATSSRKGKERVSLADGAVGGGEEYGGVGAGGADCAGSGERPRSRVVSGGGEGGKGVARSPGSGMKKRRAL
ncbi:hypothetical protein LTR62_007930 [Meristemomyces frigidus]|uniref:Uncharacterized protein n=1 Tax=Meristemomyces frigidus TaxID=1508187 RepID=A0AAN7YMA4_9PEZI|nr:hypothetical protein LTR62_007930 [Meristemomyces frigidus]